MPSASLTALARLTPRIADLAFEARRHAAQCEAHLDQAQHGLEYLRGLLTQRAKPDDLSNGRLLDVEAHLMVLELKARTYAIINATMQSIDDALHLAKKALDRLGASSTRVMQTLREHTSGIAQDTCRRVVNELVIDYTSNADRYSDIRAALVDNSC